MLYVCMRFQPGVSYSNTWLLYSLHFQAGKKDTLQVSIALVLPPADSLLLWLISFGVP